MCACGGGDTDVSDAGTGGGGERGIPPPTTSNFGRSVTSYIELLYRVMIYRETTDWRPKVRRLDVGLVSYSDLFVISFQTVFIVPAGTTSKTEENFLVAIFDPKVPQKQSQSI